MKQTLQIRAVAFDIDGTLYPNSRMYRASLALVLSHWRLFRAFGKARRKVRNHRPVLDLRRETAEITGRILGVAPEEADRRIMDVVYHRWEQVLTRVPLYPGARHLLDELVRRGVPIAAVSDFPVERKLRLLGLEDLWDVAFSSEELGYLKPNPEPFEELSRRLGVPPEHTLYVGNSYEYDVLGAGKVGFRTAHLGGRAGAPGVADVAFRDFSVLETWILANLDRDHIDSTPPTSE